MYHWEEGKPPAPPDRRALDFMAEHGLDFVRLPLDYRFWTTNLDYFHPNDWGIEAIDQYLRASQDRGWHQLVATA